MIRHGVVLSVMVVLALLFGCQVNKGARAPKAGALDGDTELTLWNKTKSDLSYVKITAEDGEYPRSSQTLLSSYGADKKTIPADKQEKWKLKAGKYRIDVQDTKGSYLLFSYTFPLTTPTEIVLWAGTEPTGVDPPAGVTQIKVENSVDVNRRSGEAELAAKNKRAADQAAMCKAKNPPPGEPASPGPTKATGKWTCVLGGEANGTNFVSIAQLADGKITATLTGADRNTTWEGAVVKDEVHYRYTGFENGGKLKLDPGGRAMSGTGNAIAADGHCMAYTVTCTRS